MNKRSQNQIQRRRTQAPRLGRPAGARPGQPASRGREALDVYLDDLSQCDLMTSAREREAAERIVSLRARYWGALLSYPPFVEVMLDAIEGELPTEDSADDGRRALRRAAVDLRSRRTRAGEIAYGDAMAKLARSLAWLDLETAVADRVTADLVALAAGREPALPLRRPPKDSARAQAHLQRVRAAAGDLRAARNAFAKANLRLVVKVARRYLGGHLTLSDLIQEGNLGLMTAIDRFDYRRGFRFSTYACWWIRHTVQRALSNKDRTVRVPCHMSAAFANVARARWAFAAANGRDPSAEELAERAGVSLDKLAGMTQLLLRPAESLDARVPGSDGAEGRTRLEALEDDTLTDPGEQLDVGTQSERVREALDRLTPMEADILRKRFGLEDEQELTLRDLGKQHALSRERIRQIQNEALVKLRRMLADGTVAA